MCNACGFLCCASDQMGECGCNSCAEVACMDTCPDCHGIIELTGCTCGDDDPSEEAPCKFCGSWGDVHDIWCSDIDTETSQQETP